MLTPERLKGVLFTVIKSAEITIEADSGRLVAIVVSDEFAGMEEVDRQAQVWEHLLKALPPEEVSQVEFVFTSTHEEAKQARA